MSRPQKEKFETFTDASFQLISESSTEESSVIVADDFERFEVSAKKRKEEANRPLYLKRI